MKGNQIKQGGVLLENAEAQGHCIELKGAFFLRFQDESGRHLFFYQWSRAGQRLLRKIGSMMMALTATWISWLRLAPTWKRPVKRLDLFRPTRRPLRPSNHADPYRLPRRRRPACAAVPCQKEFCSEATFNRERVRDHAVRDLTRNTD